MKLDQRFSGLNRVEAPDQWQEIEGRRGEEEPRARVRVPFPRVRRYLGVGIAAALVGAAIVLPLWRLWPLSGKHQEAKPAANATEIFMPTIPGWGNGNQAAFHTVLVERDGCIFGGLVPKGDALIIWPGGYSARWNADGTVEILDYEGRPVARTGEEITLGGSMSHGPDSTAYYESAIGRSIPPACVANEKYWYSGPLSDYPQPSPSPDPPDAPGVGTCPSFPAVPSPDPEDPLAQDAQEFLKNFPDLSLSDVIGMFKAQQRIGEMGVALRRAAPTGFGGRYDYWAPCPHVVVMITEGDGSATLDAVKSLGYGDLSYLIWTREVSHSESELSAAVRTVDAMNLGGLESVDGDIIGQKITIDFETEEAAAIARQRLSDAIASGELGISETAFVIEVTPLPGNSNYSNT